MLSPEDIAVRAVAQKIVDASKRSAHVDTGALKRSISYTYIRGELVFRQLFYGQFYNNSELEKNAARFVPSGVRWKIIYTSFGGQTVEVGRTSTGRATQRKSLATLLSGSTSKIKALIARNKAKKSSNG